MFGGLEFQGLEVTGRWDLRAISVDEFLNQHFRSRLPAIERIVIGLAEVVA